MTTFIVLFAIIAVIGVALVIMLAADRLPGVAPTTHDEPPRDEPTFPMSAADLAAVQFSVRFRGYDMEQVDLFIDGLMDQLAVAEARAKGDYLSTSLADSPSDLESDATSEAESDNGTSDADSDESDTGPVTVVTAANGADDSNAGTSD